MRESGTAREQSYACPAQFKAFATKPDAFPHHGRVYREGFIAALRTPAQTLQTLIDTPLNDLI